MAKAIDRIVDALLGTPTTVLPQDVENFLKTLPTTEYGKNLTPDQIQSVAQGYNYGIAPIADMQKQLGIKAPQGAEELNLARQGKLNYQQRTGGILPDINRGLQQNYNNNLVQNLGKPLQNPNMATRLGQGLGSVLKLADSPLGRGLLAAGLTKAYGGTGGQALAQGLNAGVIRQDLSAQDKLYRNQLQQMGIDTSNIRGNVNKDTFKNISDNYNRQQRNILQRQIANAKDNTQRAKLILDAHNRNQLDATEAINQLKLWGIDINKLQQSNQTQMAQAKKQDMKVRQGIAQQNANANTVRADAAKTKAEVAKTKAANAKANANDPFAGLKVPTKQQPKKQKTITVGNKKITVQ